MRTSESCACLVLVSAGLLGCGKNTGSTSGDSTIAPGAVLQHHNDLRRDGVYIDSAFTKAASANIAIDPTFHATLQGPTYAQPLYFPSGPNGDDALIVATEQNRISALDAATGTEIWHNDLAPPVASSVLGGCSGNIETVGITGTPTIDPVSRTIYAALTTTPDGNTVKELVFAVSVDDGSTRAGWPVDISAVTFNGTTFTPGTQNQRSALTLVNGTLYVGYSGRFGDCGTYHGWLIGIPTANPGAFQTWASSAGGGGIWAISGMTSDGTNIFASTGNTDVSGNTWGNGEAVIRFQPGPVFSNATVDYWAPSNWSDLDDNDQDMGGSAPLPIDVPGANPSALMVAMAKNGYVYLLNRTNLGGIGAEVASQAVMSGLIVNAPATYTTASGTYVVLNGVANGIGLHCPGQAGNLVALKIGAASPPTITTVWCASVTARGTPVVTMTDASSNPIVWFATNEEDDQLHAFDGETGAPIVSNGPTLSNLRRYEAAIVSKGRMFFATDDAVIALKPQ